MKKLCILLTALSGTAIAYAQHSDIEIVVEGGALEVEAGAEGYVFEGEFGEDLNPGNVADEPGFEVDDGMMQPGDTLGFSVAEDLLYWDGTQFAAVPGGHSLTISLAAFSTVLDGTGDSGGFDIGAADPEGGIHQDLDFTLGGPGAPDALTPGAYGLWLTMTSPQYDTSNEFIIMLNYQLDETAFEAGVEAAAALVPEPGTALLCVAGAGLLLRRRLS